DRPRDLSGSTTGCTRLWMCSRFHRSPVTAVTADSCLNLDCLLGAEYGILEINVCGDERVLSTSGARHWAACATAAEEGLEDIREPTKTAAGSAESGTAPILMTGRVVITALLAVRK